MMRQALGPAVPLEVVQHRRVHVLLAAYEQYPAPVRARALAALELHEDLAAFERDIAYLAGKGLIRTSDAGHRLTPAGVELVEGSTTDIALPVAAVREKR